MHDKPEGRSSEICSVYSASVHIYLQQQSVSYIISAFTYSISAFTYSTSDCIYSISVCTHSIIFLYLEHQCLYLQQQYLYLQLHYMCTVSEHTYSRIACVYQLYVLFTAVKAGLSAAKLCF
jgi:hypothetical protein